MSCCLVHARSSCSQHAFFQSRTLAIEDEGERGWAEGVALACRGHGQRMVCVRGEKAEDGQGEEATLWHAVHTRLAHA